MNFTRLPYISKLFLLSALIAVITFLGLRFSFVETDFAQIWSPTGLSLVIVLFLGIQYLPAVFIGTVINYIMVSQSVPLGVMFAISSTAEAAISFYLLTLVGFDVKIKRLRDVWYLFSLSAVASTLVGAFISITAIAIVHPHIWNEYLSYVGLWWFGNLVGTLIIAPLLLQLIHSVQQRWSGRRIAEYIVVLALVFVATQVVFQGWYFKEHLNYSFAYLVFPFTTWCALRFGMTGAATSTYLVALNAVISTQTKSGLFADESYSTSIILLDGFLVLLSMTSLGLAALLAEREEAEHALRRREENYRIVAERTGQLVYNYIIATGEILWSGAIEEVTQFSPSEFSRVNVQTWEQYIHPNDRANAMIMLDEAMKSKTEYYVEYRFLRKDGTYAYILDRGLFQYDSDGNAFRMLGTMADITERKSIEDKLRSSEERFRAIAYAVTVPLVITRFPDGKILYANRFFTEITGMTTEQLIGSTTPNFYQRIEDRDTLMNILVEKQRATNFEIEVITPTGKKGTIITSAELTTFQGEKAVVATFYDVTHRKRLEQALSESEERFRHLVEKSTDGICLFDRRGRLTYATPSAERMVGYTVDELKSKNMLFFTDPRERSIHRNVLETLFEKGGSVPSTQMRFRHKDGSWMYLEGAFTNLLQNPHIRSIVCNFRNVTERVQTEEKIRRSLKEKEILLKEIHHRVKNNLQIVSSLLNLHSASIKNKNVRSKFLESQNRVKSMAIAHEILYQTNDLARIDMDHYVKKLVHILQQSFVAKTMSVAITTKISNINLDVDSAIPCGLIINELVTNALKHAFIDHKKGHIHIAIVCNDNDSIELSVRDDGKGLGRGFSIEQNSSLGLTLVQALTQQLKGELHIASKRGASFSITIPFNGETLTAS